MLSVEQLTTSLRMRKASNFVFDMDVSLPMPLNSSFTYQGVYRTSRWLCFLTTCIAFILGVGVGVAVPFYVFPAVNSTLVDLPNLVNHADRNNLTTVAAALIHRPFLSQDVDEPTWNNHVPTISSSTATAAAATTTRREAGAVSSSTARPTVAVPYFAVRRRDNEISSASSHLLSKDSSALDEDNSVNSIRVTFVEPDKSTLDLSLNQQPETDNVRAESTGPIKRISGEAVQGIFWSETVEKMLPLGFHDRDIHDWQQFCQKSNVVRLEEGCGRMQNRLVTFENGTRSCCRYRQNYDQIQGEIFSFYLSRLLGIRNLPPSALGLVRPLEQQWGSVRSQLSLAQWAEDRPVVFTQFLDHLEPAYIPAPFRGPQRHLHPSDIELRKLDTESDRQELITLAQWSDLIVFDYLTANLDRMVNNLYNMQWNPAMMDSPAHNLARNTQTGFLVFLDNESGLLHGYRLLDKYEVYHKSLLDSICIFRRSTVDSLRQLQAKRNVGDLLRQNFESNNEVLIDYLPFLPEKSVKTLNNRIDRVLDQVTKCESLYGL